ncbi:MAG TPA: putative glycoside hydrolase [Solirubrobacteraceae bacterium]|nr:putative glycoside hydrolase [Solirubrobacteraceae bacterium]
MLVPPLGLKIAAAASLLALSWHVMTPTTQEPAPAGSASGKVRFVKDANTSFDAEDVQANSTAINRRFYRMTGYSSWFDRNLRWYHRARVYADAYGIYRGSAIAAKHPGWIVRDAAGNKLYIPFHCSGGSCPLFAADISNRAWRSHYISTVKAAVAKGYVGVFVDDVNMLANTSNGAGQLVAPLDHNTGKPMTDEVWRAYMVRFMEELRAALPGREITHNQVWYTAGGPAANAQVAQAVRQANWINVEFGVVDRSLGGGTGEHSLSTLLAYVDAVHALGASIDMSGAGTSARELEYTLAGYFLVNNGSDLVTGSNSQTVAHFWRGWSVSLGEAQAPRTRSSEGLFERRFTHGVVYLNEPGASTKTISLPSAMKNVAGQTVTSVTLPASSAAVLRN